MIEDVASIKKLKLTHWNYPLNEFFVNEYMVKGLPRKPDPRNRHENVWIPKWIWALYSSLYLHMIEYEVAFTSRQKYVPPILTCLECVYKNEDLKLKYMSLYVLDPKYPFTTELHKDLPHLELFEGI